MAARISPGQDAAVDFYTRVLGLEVRTDVVMEGIGMRWLTVGGPGQPELEINLMNPDDVPQPPEAVAQPVEAIAHEARGRRDRLRNFGSGQGHDRHPDMHGLDQGQAQGGPTVGVNVSPAERHLAVQSPLGQVPVRRNPEDVDGQAAPQVGQQVGADHPPSAARLVDRRGAPSQAALVEMAGVHHAVLDHPDGGAAGVPEEPVEVRHVDHGELGPIGRRVAHLADPALWRVVLEVNGRKVATGPTKICAFARKRGCRPRAGASQPATTL